MKTIVQKITPGDVPFPWSEKDPYRLPVSIDRVQKMLITLGAQQWQRAGQRRVQQELLKLRITTGSSSKTAQQ